MFYNSYRIDIASNLGKDVEEIGTYAFSYSGLNGEYTTSSKLKKIGSYAFQSALINKLNITSNVEEIGTYAFASTKLNGTFRLPSTLKSIGTYIISSTGVEEVIIPNTVTSIPQQTFHGLSKLHKLTMPIELNVSGVFSTSELEELHLTKGSTGIGFDYKNVGGDAFIGNTPWYLSNRHGGASSSTIGSKPLLVTIDNGITKIGNYMFYNSYRVQLESSIDGITIGNNAFTNSGVNL